MRFINNDGIVFTQESIVTQFSQQDTIGHQLNNRLRRTLLIKANLEADSITELLAQFFSDTVCHTARGQSSRLGMPYLPSDTATCQHCQLRQLRRLTRTRLPCNNNDLVINNCLY